MRQYNALQAIYMSFYSKKLYRDVAINWDGYALFYLLFLLALSWIYFTILLQSGFNQFYKSQHYSNTLNQIPILTIQDGKLSTPENRPYFIVDSDTNQHLISIDTTGKYTKLDEVGSPILITQTAIISKSTSSKVRIDPIPNNLNVVIDPQVIKSYLQDYLKYIWILLFPLLVIGSFLYRLVQTLIYALIGLIFSAICHANLNYGQLIQTAIVGLTPVIVLATLLEAFGIEFAYQSLFYFALAIIYLFYGVVANKSIYTFSSNR